nr:Pantothenate permease [Candidatus Pantoea persica]
MIQVPAVWLSLGVLGKKFAILARRCNAVTLNDMLYARYRSTLLIWLTSISLLVAFIGAMMVQFIGGARLLESAAGIPYNTGPLIFGGTIALYTAFGGLRASVLNDAMQGLVMLIGTFLLLFAVIHHAGRLGTAVEKLRAIDPQLVSPEGVGNVITPTFLGSFAVLLCFGVIGLPHTAVRCISYKRQQGAASRHYPRHHRRGRTDVRHASRRRTRPGDHVDHQRAAAAILCYADQGSLSAPQAVVERK